MSDPTTTPGERTGRHRLADVDPRTAAVLQAGGAGVSVLLLLGWLTHDIGQLEARTDAQYDRLRADIAGLTRSMTDDLQSIRDDIVDIRLDVQALKAEPRPATTQRR